MVQFIELTLIHNNKKCLVEIHKIVAIKEEGEHREGSGEGRVIDTEIWLEDDFWVVKETKQEILDKIETIQGYDKAVIL